MKKQKKIRIAFEPPYYNSRYLLTHPWEIITHYWRQTKWFIQRGLYGYSDRDLWGLDYYLSTWLQTALRYYAHGSGYPGYGEASTYEKWGTIVNKIADGFKASYEMDDFCDSAEKRAKLQKKIDEGMKLFIKWYGHFWD